MLCREVSDVQGEALIGRSSRQVWPDVPNSIPAGTCYALLEAESLVQEINGTDSYDLVRYAQMPESANAAESLDN